MDQSETTQMTSDLESLALNEVSIPSSFKFMIANMKHIVNAQLTGENYSTWRSQVLELFCANGFEAFLDGSSLKLENFLVSTLGVTKLNLEYHKWLMSYQNLAIALCSMISSAILPYVQELEHCHEIWTVIKRRLQATNRSRVIQLKNKLHNVKMKN